VVVSEKLLLESLDCGAGGNGVDQDTHGSPEFTIYTSRPMPFIAVEQRFGSRRASAVQVVLKDPADLSACWIESLEGGWLFLIPNASESTWLLAVGAPLEALLEQSRAIAPRLNLLSARSGEFSSCPRILSPLHGEQWLACGSGAMGFDPICGDGAAHAIREAILASAVIRAIAGGGDAPSLFSHYETLLTAAMRRHLALSAQFYQTGGSGPWWRTELESLEEGFRWCTSKLAGAGEPRYQLRGFELIERV
jgi:2-polyprenyl-6-methoxyphenol hydroxylase-like FAD-dependent oxidoreductase